MLPTRNAEESYFTVFAYGELREELQKVSELRFVFDQPTFARRMESEREPRECAEWARERATFRTARRAGMIATSGSYHVANPHGEDQAFMRSAANAFTLEGLGYERRPGVVTGVSHFQTSTEAAGLKAIFDGIWDNQQLVEDVTGVVIEQLETLYRENPPELVYFLTLYHLFRDFMEDQENPIDPALGFERSVVWNKLYDFQRDAVVGAIRKLEKYKCCIIADSVGLDKTFEALAVIKYYQERNARVIVLCPKRCGRTGRSTRGTTTTATRLRTTASTTPCSTSRTSRATAAWATRWTRATSATHSPGRARPMPYARAR